MVRSRLFAKYAWVMVTLVAAALAVAAAAQVVIIYRAQRAQAEELLRAQSGAARDRIAGFIGNIVSSVSTVNDFDQPGAGPDLARIRDEAYRLMRHSDAITRLDFVDGARCKGLRVSRVAPDVAIDCRGGASDTTGIVPNDAARFGKLRSQGVTYSEVYYPDGSEPHVDVAIASRGAGTGVVTAQISLKRIHETVAAIRIGKRGVAYVVDERGRLLAHPDLSLALKQWDASPQIRAAEAFAASGGDGSRALLTDGLEGRAVLTAWSAIPQPDWRVFVEQPAEEALEPVYHSLIATIIAFVAAVAIAVAASFALARHLSGPILALRRGAQRIGSGDMTARIKLHTRDEVAALADEFNRMAERLQESYSGLEARVAERTAELGAANVELARLKQDADNANAAKTRFLASASHDLRQPMHAISLLVGLLHERIGASHERALVEKVVLSVEAMENLFNSLLDISRLDAGAVKPRLATFEIDALLTLLQMRFAPQAAQKGIALRVVACRAAVRSDPALLERILGNLLSNAIRYTERGRVLLGCRRHGGQLRILVADTGVGIAAGDMDLVFEEFFQVANPERDRSKGLGLGLSIVKRSAALLGHGLIAHSTPGKGSLFGVVVPIAEADRAASPAAARNGGEALRNAFVLVIDDDRQSRYATEKLCAQWGCHVEAAESASEAMTKLRNHLRDPDLILCDYRLRASTGLEAVRSIRRERDVPIPAIIVTGDVTAAGSEQFDAGIALLHKPVNAERLKAAALAQLGAREAVV